MHGRQVHTPRVSDDTARQTVLQLAHEGLIDIRGDVCDKFPKETLELVEEFLMAFHTFNVKEIKDQMFNAKGELGFGSPAVQHVSQ